MAFLELDLIKVVGKKEAVRIFTLLGDAQVRDAAAFPALEAAHGEFLSAYRNQDWARARDRITACREKMDGFDLDGLYRLYQERIAEFEAKPPGAGWDGVYEATSK